MNSDDYERSGSHSYSESYGLFSIRYDSDPRTRDNIPNPYRHDKAVEDRQYAHHMLTVIASIFRVGLSPAQLEEIERQVRAYMMRHLDDIPVETIAQQLKFSTATVYRDVREMAKWVRHWAKLIVELKVQLENEGDEISQKVLEDLLKGKSIEAIKRNPKLTPKVVEEARGRIYTFARAIQEELEEREQQHTETDNASDSHYPADEPIN